LCFILPFIALYICSFIVGIPKEAGKGGLIAHLIICIISDIWLFGNAKSAKRMGMSNAVSMFWIEFVVYLAATVYIAYLIASAFQLI
jgi:hypothetical protein